MSLWFAGAFVDAPSRPSTGKKMGESTQSVRNNNNNAGEHFWFGGAYRDDLNAPNEPAQRSEYQNRRAHSAGATSNRAGKRSAPTDILATQQNVGFGGVTENQHSIHNNNLFGVTSADSPNRRIGTRFHTPHRAREQERGYHVNPITLMPMTSGPPQVAHAVFERFQTDVKSPKFFASSTDCINQVKGVRPIHAIAADVTADNNILSATSLLGSSATPRNYYNNASGTTNGAAAAPFVTPYVALSCDRTILYNDNNKEEQVFLQGCRKVPIDIPSSYEKPQIPSYATRMYPVKENRGVPFDTLEPTYLERADGSFMQRSTTPTIVRTQKKMVEKPEGRSNVNDEDNFLLKTSRMAPVDKTERSEKEGFAVLLSTDPGRLRNPLEGMRMCDRPMKVKSDFVVRTRNARLDKEQQIMLERREKCMRAFEQERLRMSTRKTHDDGNMFAQKGRAHTPPAGSRGAPFATGLPAPRMELVGKAEPWYRR